MVLGAAGGVQRDERSSWITSTTGCTHPYTKVVSMPMQSQQNSSFAARLGVRVSQANAEHAAKPVSTGNRRLPPGIKNGIAKLSAMYTKQQTEDNGMVPKGSDFFRASAVVMFPKEHDGMKVSGMLTSQTVPLCDTPAKGKREAKSFNQHWFEFQNVFKLLGIPACPETPVTDPTGVKTEAYFFAAMKALTNPQAKPVYISFSTRGWTPAATPQSPKPEEFIFEDWHGLASEEDVAKALGQFNPAAGVSEMPPTQPPTGNHAAPTQAAPPAQPTAHAPTDLTDEVASLIEAAMNDKDGNTEDGVAAHSRLEELAWANGWTREQTAAAADWAAVGEMALGKPTHGQAPATPAAAPPAAPNGTPTPGVGTRWMFAKRTKDGARLTNSKGEPFPPQEVEVVTSDAAAKTCTVKSRKDGKDILDIRTKAPVVVKWEWLEAAPPY